MSFETPKTPETSPLNGIENNADTTPVSDRYEKLERDLGFVAPLDTDNQLEYRLAVGDQDFKKMMSSYVDAYMIEHPSQPHEGSEVYEYRGILVKLSQLYYERSQHLRRLGMKDIHHDYVSKEYLRTVCDDMVTLEDPIDENFIALLEATGVKHPVLAMPKPVKFETNTIHILSKIDPAISGLWKAIKQNHPR